MNLMIEFFTNLVTHTPVLAGAIVGAVAAIVGATATLAGGFFIAMYNNRQQSKREEHKELRANLLTLNLEVSKVFAWAEKRTVDVVGSVQKIRGVLSKIEPLPTDKITALASLYFPEICKEARMLEQALSNHNSVTQEIASNLMNESPSLSPEEAGEMIRPTFADINVATKALQKASRELMKNFLTEKRTTVGKIRFWIKKLRRRD